MIIYLDKTGQELPQRDFIELQWTRKCFQPGSFSLYVRAKDWDKNIKYIQLDDRPETGIVQKVQYEYLPEGDFITASGFFIEKLLDWGAPITDMSAETTVLANLDLLCFTLYSQYTGRIKDEYGANHDSIFPPFTSNLYCAYFAPQNLTSTAWTRLQTKGGEPGGKSIYDFLRVNGYRLTAKPCFNNPARASREPMIGLIMEAKKLRSRDVYFNKSLGTAKNIEYVFDDSGAYPCIVGVQIVEDAINYSHSLYIYKDSKFQKCIYESYEYGVNAPQDVGAAKPLRVIYTSANDIENGKEASVRAQMQNALKLELLNNYKVEHIACEVLQDRYLYPRDYDLGDLCSVQLDELEVEYSARIVEIREVYHKNICETEIVLGTPTRKEYQKVL